MDKINIICPNNTPSQQLQTMVKSACFNIKTELVKDIKSKNDLKNKRLMFLLELNEIGYDIPMLSFLSALQAKDSNALEGSLGSILIHSNNEFSTKRAAQDLIWIANSLGCSFIGHPLVEATSTLNNFLTWQKSLNLPLEDICSMLCMKLGNNLLNFNPTKTTEPNLLVLYSMPNQKSNTLDLWHMCSDNIMGCKIKELQIENGKIQDCKGCSYTTCLHYGNQNKCFYGGIMIDDVLPSIEKANALIMLCPNYNDAVASNLTALINRLTVLYNKISFHDKALFSVVVSGNSGSDSVCKQLIGALNINKGFWLPPNAFLTATANDPNAVFKLNNINFKAKTFAVNLMNSIKEIQQI